MSDLAALLAAVDAGDDEVWFILADLLEEAGDPRAPYLRPDRLGARRPQPVSDHWAWSSEPADGAAGRPEYVADEVLARSPAAAQVLMPQGGRRVFAPTRADAFLALIEAMAAERPSGG